MEGGCVKNAWSNFLTASMDGGYVENAGAIFGHHHIGGHTEKSLSTFQLISD